MTIFFEQLRFC